VKEELVYLGVDIAKSYLDAAIGGEKRRFSNDTIGHRQLIKWVKQRSVAVQVICESSGGYERGLVRALVGARVKISLIQANRVRQFARAAGILAKTDCIDAQVLCEFGKVMRPPMVTAATLEQEHLRELESQRRHLTHLLVMEQNRGARLSDASVVRLNRSLINQIKKQIDRLDLLIKNHIARSKELSAKAAKLTSISGVGARTPLRCSWLRCRNWENSIVARSQLWLESLRLIATAERCVVNVRSTVVVDGSATVSTWQRSSLHATTRSCATFISDCEPPVNQPNSPSQPRCENF
jgi:hypothetical protein